MLGWDTETASSCDDSDTGFTQRCDDDKMELMGASDRLNLAVMNMSQFGQAKSPFHIEFREDVDEDKVIYIAVDGEFYKVKNARRMNFIVDQQMPRIKMLRFNPDSLL